MSGTNYYDEHAQAFIESTLNADVSGLYARFEEKLTPGCSILDLGCGSGRDSLYFTRRGYEVSALDPSPAMCAQTRALAGVPVCEMQAEEMDFDRQFDAVWACASLLHVPRELQAEVLHRIARALKEGGICYCSWKYGELDREKDGRHFTDLTEASFRELMQNVPELREEAVWTTQDVRKGRGGEKWLNALVRRTDRIVCRKDKRTMTENMIWTREPENYSITEDRIEITTEPGTDLWQRTYYHFRNDNAPALQFETDEKYFSFIVKTDFTDAHHRFDQCGIVLYLDSENWLKGSVEYENEEFQHLGSVVTNHGYSDWATTAIPTDVRTMWYRLSRRENDYCIECSQDGEHFTQMRVCHLWEGAGTIRFGIYACSPEDSSFKAVFTDMQITECAWKAHDGQQPDEG